MATVLGGTGGPGVSSSISGTSVYYAGGGGGNNRGVSGSAGGLGGGGTGSGTGAGQNAFFYGGGGGSAGSGSGTGQPGGNGYQGIVILSYQYGAGSNDPGLILSNPGTVTLFSGSASPSVTLSLVNPYSVTPTWSYPTITGITWSSSNSGITLTVNQGFFLSSQIITVAVSYGSYVYTQTFTLSVTNTTGYTLTNPGTTYLFTDTSQQTVSLTLTNPFSFTPTWTYPTLSGVTWSPTNTGITLTAAQGSTLSTQSVSVLASYAGSSVSQTFSLTIAPNPGFVLSNPGTTTLNTVGSPQSVVLTLTNPYNVTPLWSYPTLTGVTWFPTTAGITLIAAQGSTLSTQPVTVTAAYGAYSYPQTFSLTIANV